MVNIHISIVVIILQIYYILEESKKSFYKRKFKINLLKSEFFLEKVQK